MTPEIEIETYETLIKSAANTLRNLPFDKDNCQPAVAQTIYTQLRQLNNPTQAIHLSQFFKTGKGQYGEDDKFLGIKVPQTRSIVSQSKNKATIADVEILTLSHFHEIRLAGFLLLIEIYNNSKKQKNNIPTQTIINYYISIIPRGNNWDLVDTICPKILGDWITHNPQQNTTLLNLANTSNLWQQRTSIVATIALIRKNNFATTITICKKMMTNTHDLIHKATGWMLREIGKKDTNTLLKFLDQNHTKMPRTTIRYAIEHLSPQLRQKYLKKNITKSNTDNSKI